MTPVFIYTLNDPVTGIVRYCGQTVDPDTRLSKHLHKGRHGKYHCAQWVNSLLLRNLRPVMEILDVVPDNEADFWEREYIQNFRERGFDLTNITPGGEGGPTMLGKKLSPAHCAAISAGLKGVKKSPAHCVANGLAKKGTKMSPESSDKKRVAISKRSRDKKGRVL